MQLQKEESYTWIQASAGRAPGIQVVNTQQAGSPVLWEISGVVVFAGEHFRPLKGVATVCETVQAARAVDVGVVCEDAKPYVSFRPLHVLAAAAINFAQLSMFFVLMGAFEPGLEPEEIPWWRISYNILSILPYYFAAAADIGAVLMGTTLDSRLAAALACAAMVSQAFTTLTPLGWVGGRFHMRNVFMAGNLNFSGYAVVVTSLLWLQRVWRRAPPAAEPRRQIRWRAHCGWFLWMVVGTLGSWQVLYFVALLYINLSTVAPGVAAVALPLLTSMVEQFVVVGTIQAYRILVTGTRRKEWGFTFLGDQRQMLMIPIALTHSFSESTRLASILVPTVRSPGAHWVGPLLVNFAFNVSMRSYHWTRLLCSVLPTRCGWLFGPDAGTLLHNEARFCFGYPRFVPLLALGLANLGLRGFDDWPLFNFHATLLVATALALEGVEDLIVTSGVLRSDAWKAKLVHTYREMDLLHPQSIMGFDSGGIQPGSPALNFSGMRFERFCVAVAAVQPSCMFAYNLLALLLGAGFVHGVCGAPLEQRQGQAGGLSWISPLEC